MTGVLLGIVVVLIVVAVAVQVAYLRGLARAGVEITRTTRVVTYFNIVLLVVVAIGVVALALWGEQILALFT